MGHLATSPLLFTHALSGTGDWPGLLTQYTMPESNMPYKSTIIILDGPSSTGKTTLTNELQQTFDRPYVNLGLDKFLEMVPLRFVGYDKDIVHFTSRKTSCGPRVTITIGKKGKNFDSGRIQAAKAFADLGNNLIIDEILLDKVLIDEYIQALKGHKVLLIGLTCPLEILQQRELARGDRRPGLAATQAAITHRHTDYDRLFDTSTVSPQDMAKEIQKIIREGKQTIFDQLQKVSPQTEPQTLQPPTGEGFAYLERLDH